MRWCDLWELWKAASDKMRMCGCGCRTGKMRRHIADCREYLRLLWVRLRRLGLGLSLGSDLRLGCRVRVRVSVSVRVLSTVTSAGKSSESVQCTITGPCLRIRHRPSAWRTVPIRKIYPSAFYAVDSTSASVDSHYTCEILLGLSLR